ncbi:hypothetical protein IDAT_12895 [Pseudidiomarina atlantica]|uniref:Uncharacterized protein n=1 Tax=Pseudidiomarina atlantica TaxID=1517416 RepID=A0A094IJ71_9GAMM|nr:hypothetical protein IDAT_12895 [Pseudidiomarina atlantica]
MLMDILVLNFVTGIVVLIAIITCRKKAFGKLFSLGLFIILTSGIIAVPYTSWILTFSESLPRWVFNPPMFTIPIGILNSVGLLLCIKAFSKSR